MSAPVFPELERFVRDLARRLRVQADTQRNWNGTTFDTEASGEIRNEIACAYETLADMLLEALHGPAPEDGLESTGGAS